MNYTYNYSMLHVLSVDEHTVLDVVTYLFGMMGCEGQGFSIIFLI